MCSTKVKFSSQLFNASKIEFLPADAKKNLREKFYTIKNQLGKGLHKQRESPLYR